MDKPGCQHHAPSCQHRRLREQPQRQQFELLANASAVDHPVECDELSSIVVGRTRSTVVFEERCKLAFPEPAGTTDCTDQEFRKDPTSGFGESGKPASPELVCTA